jgi:hypothetical protein
MWQAVTFSLITSLVNCFIGCDNKQTKPGLYFIQSYRSTASFCCWNKESKKKSLVYLSLYFNYDSVTFNSDWAPIY